MESRPSTSSLVVISSREETSAGPLQHTEADQATVGVVERTGKTVLITEQSDSVVMPCDSDRPSDDHRHTLCSLLGRLSRLTMSRMTSFASSHVVHLS